MMLFTFIAVVGYLVAFASGIWAEVYCSKTARRISYVAVAAATAGLIGLVACMIWN